MLLPLVVAVLLLALLLVGVELRAILAAVLRAGPLTGQCTAANEAAAADAGLFRGHPDGFALHTTITTIPPRCRSTGLLHAAVTGRSLEAGGCLPGRLLEKDER